MQLEFLDDISDGGRYTQVVSQRLLRLYAFDTKEAFEFKQAIQEMIAGQRKEIDLASLSFINRVNCNLLLQISEINEGITTKDRTNFTCNLTTASYENMLMLIAPFCGNASGHQWLYNLDAPFDFLFSPSGTW